MKYTLPGPPPSQFSPFPSPSFFFLRRKKRKLLFRIHCRECSWTGNLFSPRFDTARPLVLLLTLAKHSDNYFCWFQIASSGRVWSQQVFFACWACPFRHPERSRGKDDGFFSFLSSCTLAFPERTFRSRECEGEAQMRSGFLVTEENRAGTSLSEGSYSQQSVFLHVPSGSSTHFPLCEHTTHPEPPTPPWLCMTTQGPSQKSPVLICLLYNALKSEVPSRSP